MPLSKRIYKIYKGAFIALFSFLVMQFSPVNNAFAADADSLRIGGDYKFLTLREGARYQECARACENDVSCKAWTFIKQRVRNREGLNLNLGPDLNIGFGGRKEIIPPQCRLKHSIGPKHDNECCTSGVKRIVQSSRPSKAERCADYAEKALDQQDKNLAERCGFRGTRWQANYRHHYRWCMDSSRRSAERETQARDDELRSCTDDRRVRDRGCERYASTAMDILQQARENNCGKSSRGWGEEYERVYEWCLDNGRAKRADMLDRAQSKLASCIRRGGGPLIERCETYADTALEQIKKSRTNQCGNSGILWRNSFRAQYRFCRNNNRRELRRASERREASLDRCLRRSDERRVMETGSVDVRQRNARQWHTVRFRKKFRNPVVIMGPVSFNGGDPAHARVRRVTPRGFEFRIEEFGKDGAHIRESLSYMAVEKGIHKFEGMVIEAGTITTSADLVDRSWSMVRLSNRWREAPLVLAQVQTFRGPDPVSARIKGISRRRFEVTLSEQESDRQGHTRETVAFVAINRGRHVIDGGRDANTRVWSGRVSRVTDRWKRIDFPRRFGIPPAVFAKAQSSNGADTFDIRYRALSDRRVDMRLQEEQSKDRETRHTNEVLGILALPTGGYWSTSSSSIDDQVADDPVRPVEPVDPALDVPNCETYARRAVAQFRRSQRHSCGFIGSNWHRDERRHVRWCRRNGLHAANRFLLKHESQLEQCIDGTGDDIPPVDSPKNLEWKRVDGRLRHISMGSDGTVWGVNSSNRVYRRVRGRWREVRGRLKMLDVGNARNIWGIGTDDRIYRWGGRSWKQVRGRLKNISVGSDGTVWGTNSNDQIFWWDGRRWQRISGFLREVSVGNRNAIWGVNSQGTPFRWTGKGFVQISGRLKHVAVAKNGDVFALGTNARVLQYDASRRRWMGRGTRTFAQLSGGDGSRLWGVTGNDRIFRSGYDDRRTPPPVEEELDGWVALGCAKASFKNDRDDIAVGRGKGRFTALQLRGRRTAVRIREVRVTFGNGRQQVLPFTGTLGKRARTRAIDLNGNRRFISRITLSHRSRLVFPPVEGRVCVYGKQ